MWAWGRGRGGRGGYVVLQKDAAGCAVAGVSGNVVMNHVLLSSGGLYSTNRPAVLLCPAVRRAVAKPGCVPRLPPCQGWERGSVLCRGVGLRSSAYAAAGVIRPGGASRDPQVFGRGEGAVFGRWMCVCVSTRAGRAAVGFSRSAGATDRL